MPHTRERYTHASGMRNSVACVALVVLYSWESLRFPYATSLAGAAIPGLEWYGVWQLVEDYRWNPWGSLRSVPNGGGRSWIGMVAAYGSA